METIEIQLTQEQNRKFTRFGIQIIREITNLYGRNFARLLLGRFRTGYPFTRQGLINLGVNLALCTEIDSREVN